MMLCFFQPSIEQKSIIDSTDEATKALEQKPLQVHHRDCVSFYNDYTNLEIVTHQVNLQTGTFKKKCLLCKKFSKVFLIKLKLVKFSN